MNYVLSEEEYRALKGESENIADRYDAAFCKEIQYFIVELMHGAFKTPEEATKRLSQARSAGLKAAKQ